MRHTKGTWKRGKLADNMFSVFDQNGRRVAQVNSSIGEDAESNGNADLIAAAPLMREAIVQFVKACKRGFIKPETIRLARKALRAGSGRSSEWARQMAKAGQEATSG